ncbi:MAG: Omp28-related outer membrane protein [Bacteroidia bacterium]|nr:Omp28-related outer membrane protein [Bacteroidia bacterium]
MKILNKIKSIKTLQIIALSIFALASCSEETPPGLNFTPERSVFDTTYITNNIPAAQATNVLIEDFTGVKCPNCPRAQGVAKNLMTANPKRVFVMAMHPGKGLLSTLTSPFKTPGDDHDSKYDFRTEEAADLLTMLGGTSQLPIGSINRTLFNGEPSILIIDPKWSGKTSEKLNTTSIVNIDTFGTKGVYYVDANTIRINVKLSYTAASTDSQFVSIAIIEDGILDYQENGTVVEENYEHNHILRRMITPTTGSQLKASIVLGRVFEKTYDYQFATNETWNRKNLKLVVFVHNGTNGTNKFVVQQVKEYEIH